MIGYDHEPIFAAGSMLGIGKAPGLLRLLDEIEVQGLDVMSAGVALAWATEAQQNGLVTSTDTGGLHLEFGTQTSTSSGPADRHQPPTSTAPWRTGRRTLWNLRGAEYALTFGGNEMPGTYRPGCTWVT